MAIHVIPQGGDYQLLNLPNAFQGFQQGAQTSENLEEKRLRNQQLQIALQEALDPRVRALKEGLLAQEAAKNGIFVPNAATNTTPASVPALPIDNALMKSLESGKGPVDPNAVNKTYGTPVSLPGGGIYDPYTQKLNEAEAARKLLNQKIAEATEVARAKQQFEMVPLKQLTSNTGEVFNIPTQVPFEQLFGNEPITSMNGLPITAGGGKLAVAQKPEPVSIIEGKGGEQFAYNHVTNAATPITRSDTGEIVSKDSTKKYQKIGDQLYEITPEGPKQAKDIETGEIIKAAPKGGMTEKQRLDEIQKIQKNITSDKTYQKFETVTSNANNFFDIAKLAGKGVPGTDIALKDAFNQIFNPKGVVRQFSFAATDQGKSFLQKAESFYQQLKKGQSLTPQQVGQMAQIVNIALENIAQETKGAIDPQIQNATALGIPFTRVTPTALHNYLAPHFDTEEEVENAGLPDGTPVYVNGRKATYNKP